MTLREIYNRKKREKKSVSSSVPTIVPILNDIKRLNKHDKPEKKNTVKVQNTPTMFCPTQTLLEGIKLLR